MKWAYSFDFPMAKKSVLVALAYFSNDMGTCFPSISTLKRMTGASRRCVFKQISELEQDGILTRIDDKKHKSSLYQLHFTEEILAGAPGAPGASSAPSNTPASAPNAPLTSAPGASSETPLVHQVHQASAPGAPPSAPGAPLLVHLVHPNINTNSQLTAIEHKAHTIEEWARIKNDFEILYKTYPVRKDREAALRVFSTIDPSTELFAEMLIAIANQNQERKYSKFYTGWAARPKSLENWLRGKNWTDEVNLDENQWRECNKFEQKFAGGKKSKSSMLWDNCAPGAFGKNPEELY